MISVTAKCRICGLYWNISILQAIPETGYTCPWCDARAEAQRRAAEMRERFIATGILKKEGTRNEMVRKTG